MKNQRKAWLAAGLLALVAAACFSDPTSDLRSGPVAIVTTYTTVSVKAGDSVDVRGVVKDAQGNPLPVGGAQWTSADPTVAVVNPDTVALAPGDIFTRAFIRGVNNQAGVTTVTVTAQGISASVRVSVLPKTFPGAVTITGTVGPDTILVNRPPPQTALVVPYTAGDTLVLDATATITFNPTTSNVSFGAFPAYVVARSATQIKAVARQAYAGKVTVTNLIYAGDAATGPIAIPTIQTDSVLIQHGRLTGGTVTAASAFGPNTQLTITANAGISFGTTADSVFIGTTPAIVLSRNATTIVAIVPANVTGTMKVKGITAGIATVDSLRAGAPTTINASFFPGTVTSANSTGNLLDTIYVNAGGGATFTPASSVVTIGGVPTFIVGTRTASLLKVIAHYGVTGQLSVSNVIVAGVTIPSLLTQNPVSVSTTVTGEANEPANNAANGFVFTMGLTAAPSIFYGAGNVATDVDDYYTFTLAAPATVTLRLDFGGTSNSIDFDMWVRNGANNAYVGGFGAATAANPENLVLTALPAGTYHIVVDAYAMAQTSAYKLTASHP